MYREFPNLRTLPVSLAFAVFTLSVAYAQGPISLPVIEPDNADGGFVLNGAENLSSLGYVASTVGDMNGDGFDDFIAGAQGVDVSVSNEGQSYVVFGGTTGASLNATSVVGGTRGFAINGVHVGGFAGNDVAGVGDVSGDGVPDVAVGATNVDFPMSSGAGQVYVVFGKSDGTAVDAADIIAGSGGFAINPDENSVNGGGLLGLAIDGIGDMNADGFDDMVIGAPHGDRVYVVFGKGSGDAVILEDIEIGTGGFDIFGGDDIGWAVAGVGDINGDGIPDLLLGDLGADPSGRTNAGQAHVVFGKMDMNSVSIADIIAGTGGFTIIGARAQDSAGTDVSFAGDVNGDGLNDLLIGATGADPGGRSAAGAAYVVFGKASTTPIDLLDVEAGIGGFVINGVAANDNAGFGVGPAGDVNGDGLADILVGATEATGASQPGRVYIVYGKTTGTAVELSNVAANSGGFGIFAPINTGSYVGGEFGRAVDSGDINGDGLPDVVAGGYLQDILGANDEGRVWTVFSPVTPANTATYLARTRAGDGASGATVPPTTHESSRAIIDFSDDDNADNGAGGASTEMVTLTRSGVNIVNLNIRPANVLWEVATDRTGFSSASLTFRYTHPEIAHLVESSLRLFKADSPTGPWTDITEALDTGRNQITGDTTTFSYFALGGTSIVPNAQTWVDFNYNGQEIGTQPNPFNTIKEAAQFIVANGTINIQPGTTSETFSFSKKMTLKTTGGTVRIGD